MTISRVSTDKADDVSTITATEWNQLDTNVTRCIDGVGGGAVSPSAKIQIGGANGLEINGSGAAARLRLSSRSITRAVTSEKINVSAIAAAFGNVSVTVAGGAWFQALLVPNGATITAITAYIDPADDALPTTNAQLDFVRQVVTTGVTTTVSTTVDPNTGASYQALHGFGPTGLTEFVDRTTMHYYISMSPEVGGDTDAYSWKGTTVTYTVVDQDDGY